MISKKYKCIYIHIPKCAGTSIETKLCQDEGIIPLGQDHRTIMDLEPFDRAKVLLLYKPDQVFSLMRRLKYYLCQKKYGSYYSTTSRHIYNNYFKFSIVRNPWSRVYSWYKNVIRDRNHQIRYKVPGDCTFTDFVKYHYQHPALRSQMHWLKDSNDQIHFDYIGKFHRLADDFREISKLIGINDPTLPKKLYTGTSSKYFDAYDRSSIKIIADRYKEEIDYFNFKFDDE